MSARVTLTYEDYAALPDDGRRYELYLSPIDVILSRITVLQPDLIFVARDRLGIVTERAIEGSPTLVVEVLSPSTNARDRGSSRRSTHDTACRTTGSSTLPRDGLRRCA